MSTQPYKGQHPKHAVADFTNPDHLKAFGLKLKGRKIVSDDGAEEEHGELTDEQAKKIGL